MPTTQQQAAHAHPTTHPRAAGGHGRGPGETPPGAWDQAPGALLFQYVRSYTTRACGPFVFDELYRICSHRIPRFGAG